MSRDKFRVLRDGAFTDDVIKAELGPGETIIVRSEDVEKVRAGDILCRVPHWTGWISYHHSKTHASWLGLPKKEHSK